jgi:hypothetical protein
VQRVMDSAGPQTKCYGRSRYVSVRRYHWVAFYPLPIISGIIEALGEYRISWVPELHQNGAFGEHLAAVIMRLRKQERRDALIT